MPKAPPRRTTRTQQLVDALTSVQAAHRALEAVDLRKLGNTDPLKQRIRAARTSSATLIDEIGRAIQLDAEHLA